MVLPGRHDRGGRDGDPVAGADAWFLANGLSYFVPECRREAREALSPRRTVPRLLVVALVAAGAGVALAWGTGQVSAAPAVVLTLVLLAVGSYALTVLHVRPILAWALRRTASSLPSLLPQMTRALPLLLIFVTFLFINAEVWQLAASLQTGTLWLVVLLFVGMAVAFLLVRLPEEVDRADDAVDEDFLRRACRRTPLEGACEELLADPGADPVARATVTGFERGNLVLFLVIVQFVQVLLLAGTLCLLPVGLALLALMTGETYRYIVCILSLALVACLALGVGAVKGLFAVFNTAVKGQIQGVGLSLITQVQTGLCLYGVACYPFIGEGFLAFIAKVGKGLR